MTLLYPIFLLPAGVALVLFLVARLRSGGGDWPKLLSVEVMRYLSPGAAQGGRRSLALLALALVLAALASPALKRPGAEAYASSEGLLVLADLSRSMTLADIAPSRLSALKGAAHAVADAAGVRPLGLIVYAGDAYVAQPFALDRGQYRSFVAALAHGIVAEEGSDPARALALAASAIRQAGLVSARVVILTDGGGFGGEAADLARQLRGRNARTDIVLTGRPGTPPPGAVEIGPVAAVAEAGGGELVVAGPFGATDIGTLKLGLDALDAGGYAALAIDTTRWQNLSHFLLLAALPLFLLLFRRTAL